MDLVFDFFKNWGSEIIVLILSGKIFIDKRKAKAEASTTEIENGLKLVNMYKDALDDLPNRYETRFQEVEQLWSKKVQMLQEEVQHLEASYQRKTKLLEDEIKLKNKFIVSLRREVRERDTLIKQLEKRVNDAENSNHTK